MGFSVLFFFSIKQDKTNKVNEMLVIIFMFALFMIVIKIMLFYHLDKTNVEYLTVYYLELNTFKKNISIRILKYK